MKFKNSKTLAFLAFAGLFFSCKKEGEKFPDGIEHVIVIGVDGLSPDGIQKSKSPIIHDMIANGSVKWNVRTVLTSSSSQNWASMISGAGPEQHGVINNDWEMDDHSLPPIVQEADGRFPTIFSVLHREKPEVEIGTVYHWDGFGRLFQKSAVNYDKRFSTEDSTATDFIRYIKEKKPVLGFVHFDHVDHAGHHGGHGSAEYYQAVAKTDSLVGQILKGIKDAGIEENTLVIIWADHGGIGYGHGGATPQEAEIAGIFYGKDVKKGYKIEQQVYTYDLAATIAFALKVTPPYAWIGRPVKPVFEGFSEPENLYLGEKTVAQPVIYPDRKLYQQAGGLYTTETATVKIDTKAEKGVTRYTTDGSDPKNSSPVYKEPFTVNKTTVVKAKSYDEKGNASLLSTAYFRLVKPGQGNGLTTTFYQGKDLTKIPVFSTLKKGSSWTSPEFNINRDQINGMVEKDNFSFALQFSGFIQIDTPGKYTFSTQSDDGSKLYIDGKEIVDNDGNHGVQEETGSAELTAGKHAIRVDYYNNGGGFWLDTFYKGPGIAKQLIPADKLFTK
ncbi:alkaline phosphatase family protein [Dyadobacter subterraneus]|uniref:Alkaline phosphatase family protein n=1 Tax=Dyadobacter subterraneus TaxID=2773304 RepID=A0ABR9WA82_9BACT|nr:alkaline phosphatase family protein [Dyadobacter subterraneus]MBE9462387.1 alkaline phosphatase family protein [Dyadobacter subterraneus]